MPADHGFRGATDALVHVCTYEFVDFRIFKFWIFGFSDFPNFGISVFQILEIGEIFEKIWKNKGGVKIHLSQAKLSFGTPKGVITARKKSHSAIRNAFSTFSGFLNSLTLGFFYFELLVEKVQINQY